MPVTQIIRASRTMANPPGGDRVLVTTSLKHSRDWVDGESYGAADDPVKDRPRFTARRAAAPNVQRQTGLETEAAPPVPCWRNGQRRDVTLNFDPATGTGGRKKSGQ